MTIPLLKHIQNLPSLCTAVVSTLWTQMYGMSGHPFYRWGSERHIDFYNFAHSVLGCTSLSPSVVYTSLKYVKNYIYSLQHPPVYGSERAIFLVALMLAYKIVEDYGPMNSTSWSRASMIPRSTLVRLEIDFLHQLQHALHMEKSYFTQWVNECNNTHDYVNDMTNSFTNYAYQATMYPYNNTTWTHSCYSHYYKWYMTGDPTSCLQPPSPTYCALRRPSWGSDDTVDSQDTFYPPITDVENNREYSDYQSHIIPY